MPLTRDERGYVASLPVETLGSGGNGTDLRRKWLRPAASGRFLPCSVRIKHAFARQKTPGSSYLRLHSIGLSMARSSCAVRMEPLEGMGFLTDSGSIRTVQRDLCYKLDIT